MPIPRRIKCQDGSRIAFFWIESAVVEHFYKLTPHAVGVYLVICKYARNTTQEAWPSIQTIANLLGCSPNSVRKGVRSLEESKLIAVRQAGRPGREHNVYTALDVGKPKIRRKATSAAKNKGLTPSRIEGAPSPFEPAPSQFAHELEEVELDESNKKEQKQGITIPESSWVHLTEYLASLPAVEWRSTTRDNSALRALWAITPDEDAIIEAVEQAAAERDDADGIFGMAAGILKQRDNRDMRASA